MTFTTDKLLILLAMVCFIVAAVLVVVTGPLTGLPIPLGLAFFSAAFLFKA